MKHLLKCFFISMLLFSLALISTEAKPNPEEEEHDEDATINDDSLIKTGSQSSILLHGNGRLLLHTRRLRLTCNKFPRICHAKGSPGPHCCKKKCVNVLADRLNCGRCGKKCKYNEICCKGKCVNPSFDRRHCGGCSNRCKQEGFCAFGLCNYA